MDGPLPRRPVQASLADEFVAPQLHEESEHHKPNPEPA